MYAQWAIPWSLWNEPSKTKHEIAWWLILSCHAAMALGTLLDSRPDSLGERSRLEEMVGDLAGALVDGTGIEPLDRVGDAGVQLLSARSRDAGK